MPIEVEYTTHAKIRMITRGIAHPMVEQVLTDFEEEGPGDAPGTSVRSLVFGDQVLAVCFEPTDAGVRR